MTFQHVKGHLLLGSYELKNYNFQYFDRSETGGDQAKICLAGQHDQQLHKNYFES